MAGTDPAALTGQNSRVGLNISGSQVGLSGFTTTASNQPSRSDAQANAQRRAQDYRRKQRQNSRNLEESKEADTGLQLGLNGSEIRHANIQNNSRTRQNAHHSRNRSKNQGSQNNRPSLNRNQNQPGGASLGQILGMNALSPSVAQE